MLNSIKHQIMHQITSFSDSDDYLGELLSYCIGRLCLKSVKAGNDWRKELNSIDVPHIVDWLKAAIINDEAWLKNVDEKNRPKKLMKFGSFEDVQKEADKAMLRANQKNCNIKLAKGDEELYMQLEGGFHLVKLLTPAALDREGSEMQHCIGGGAYDEFLNSNQHYFLSLRDGYGKPHATLELNHNALIQLQGKQNEYPSLKYARALKPFLTEAKLQINIQMKYLGYVVSSDGSAYDIDSLPDCLEVYGSLLLFGASIEKLPPVMSVGGNLDLRNTRIDSLPENLKVGGDLLIAQTAVKSLPSGLQVKGDLELGTLSLPPPPDDVDIGGCIYCLPSQYHNSVFGPWVNK